jgi:copper chaperone CopZ
MAQARHPEQPSLPQQPSLPLPRSLPILAEVVACTLRPEQRSAEEGRTMKAKYEINGMTCGGCQRALQSALRQSGVNVELSDISVAEGTLLVEQATDVATLRAAVEAAGFQLREPLV